VRAGLGWCLQRHLTVSRGEAPGDVVRTLNLCWNFVQAALFLYFYSNINVLISAMASPEEPHGALLSYENSGYRERS
jgi:hypothetical protein